MHVAHGHTSCVLCPAVMKFNAKVNAERQRRASNALWADAYIAEVLSRRGLSPESSDLGDMLDGLFREYGMPRTLKEVGVAGDDKLKKLAEQSLEDPWCRTNPIPLTRPEQVLEILRQVEV